MNKLTEKLGTNYKPINDFVDFKGITDIQRNTFFIAFRFIRDLKEKFIKNNTYLVNKKSILIPRQEEFTRKNLLDQQGSLPKPQIPLPNVPMPNVLPVTASVNPTTNLTRTETALLSPEEQVIAQRGRGGGIMDLV